MVLTYPDRKNRNAAIEFVVYETDRENETRRLLPGVTMVQPDWDIDRAGSKSRVDIATHQQVLRDGMWIAPYLRIVPEVGDIIEQQMGHFRLETPDMTFDSTVDKWGDDVIRQSAIGGDIVDMLARASLPFTVYTPRGCNVMADVKYLIKLATAGVIEPIPLVDGSFEASPLGSGWSPGFYGGAAGTLAATPSNPATTFIPDGNRALGMHFTSQPLNGYALAGQQVAIPANTTRLMLTGFHYLHNPGYEGRFILQFRDESDATISSTNHRLNTQWAFSWERGVVVADVPDNAATVVVYLREQVIASGATGARPMWDDVRLYSITGDPLPDNRINLPVVRLNASNRIQTTGGASIAYDAINANRLGGIGHYAIYTDMTGVLTTSPSRTLANTTPSHTYAEGDYRFIGVTEVRRSAANRFNTVTAVKESFDEDTAPMVVTVWNDDPDDAWSVHHLGNVRYPNGPLMVQDAVNTDTLEAAAREALARATEQQELSISVRPDPTLAVHSVIEIESEHEDIAGRWLVEYLRPGMSANDPIVEIGARRSLSSVGVIHG